MAANQPVVHAVHPGRPDATMLGVLVPANRSIEPVGRAVLL
ncbi:MAG TPA: hypothetical protein VG497_21025 [Kribbella sp.]|nr:hypothetical protein [Kribbella sp.]